MKTSKTLKGLSLHTAGVALLIILILSGCATQDYVSKQVDPVTARLSQTETRLGQAEGQISQLDGRMTTSESKISRVEGELQEVDAKAEQVLASLGNLKLEHRLIIDMKEGANFEFNSAALPDSAKQKIDEFLSNLKVDLTDDKNVVLLVAGHTDSSGSDEYNYELGKRRANAVSSYLVTQKKIDPLQVVTVSYGENSPITENDTRDGRARNRRVEILIYQETINPQ